MIATYDDSLEDRTEQLESALSSFEADEIAAFQTIS